MPFSRTGIILLLAATASTSHATLAPAAIDVPALDTWGLLGISALLAVVGAAAILRRRRR